MIDQLDAGAVAELQELLPRLPNAPLAHLVHVTGPQTRAYWLDEIRRDLADPSTSACPRLEISEEEFSTDP